MTPTTAELLNGCVAAIATPPQAEDLALYFKGKLSLVALIAILAAQEADRGAAVRVAENAAIRAVLGEDDPGDHATRLVTGDDEPADPDLSITALDAANAALRRRLIALHEAVEAEGDRDRDREILALYRRMAELRTLVLPPMTA